MIHHKILTRIIPSSFPSFTVSVCLNVWVEKASKKRQLFIYKQTNLSYLYLTTLRPLRRFPRLQILPQPLHERGGPVDVAIGEWALTQYSNNKKRKREEREEREEEKKNKLTYHRRISSTQLTSEYRLSPSIASCGGRKGMRRIDEKSEKEEEENTWGNEEEGIKRRK